MQSLISSSEMVNIRLKKLMEYGKTLRLMKKAQFV